MNCIMSLCLKNKMYLVQKCCGKRFSTVVCLHERASSLHKKQTKIYKYNIHEPSYLWRQHEIQLVCTRWPVSCWLTDVISDRFLLHMFPGSTTSTLSASFLTGSFLQPVVLWRRKSITEHNGKSLRACVRVCVCLSVGPQTTETGEDALFPWLPQLPVRVKTRQQTDMSWYLISIKIEKERKWAGL